MVDQICLPGCEGGPVFDDEGYLVGVCCHIWICLLFLTCLKMLTPPLRRNDGSNVEVYFILPIQPFFHSMSIPRMPFEETIGLSKSNLSSKTRVVSDSLTSIVLLSIGSFWGSGILISENGHILTSAHIFKQFVYKGSSSLNPDLYPGYHIEIRIDQSTKKLSSRSEEKQLWYRATLLYISNSHLDVALLKIDKPPLGLKPMKSRKTNHLHTTNAYSDPVKGEKIFVLGYSLFGPSKKLNVTCTSGIISGVSFLHGRPHLIQTNAAVNKGASGGAVVDSEGYLLGLVTCNAMTNDGTIIPKINFSIPMQLLSPIWDYLQHKDPAYLQPLNIFDKECESLWNFSTPEKQKPSKRESQLLDILEKVQKSTTQKPLDIMKSKL